ncbi:MAG: hypothetical protein KAI66_21610, partial [Lentisphaeria bacterium]|nr:hypothetical protein [Lentisphaeria bacterium]
AIAVLKKGEDAQRVNALLREAAAALAPSATTAELEKTRESLSKAENALTDELTDLRTRFANLNEEKRRLSKDEAKELEHEIERISDRRETLVERRDEVARDLERNTRQLEATERVASTAARLNALAEGTEGQTTVPELKEILTGYTDFDASLRRYFLGDVPWGVWVRPLMHWGVLIGLTYMVLMTFNVLIFRQWAYNEKLIFPLAELPEILAGADTDGPHDVPEVFRSGLFWVGFSISAFVMGYNLLCKTGIAPGLPPLDLNNSWAPYIRNSMFKGLLWGAKSAVFFTMIGVAFLIPKKVSFSLWFFHILYMVQILVLVGFGYGQNESSFPHEWWYTLNFRTAEGGGALLVFASLVMWKCRRFLFCAWNPSALGDMGQDERRELLISSWLFLTGSLGVVLMLWRGLGVNLFYAVFGYAVIMVITIGLVRAVAEGGVLGFQAWVSPFHFIRHVLGFDKAAGDPSLFAPLMVYYSIMFLDIKTFIAPAMANGLKVRDDLKMARGRYHFAVALGISVACVVAIATAVMMCYSGGADAMHNWFYTSFPRSLFARIADISKVPPTATAGGRFWLVAGGVMMAGLLYFRQSFFWLPHPIGFIMLVNPLMRTYWFSIMLGWLAKHLVTKYGNKDTYGRVRYGFIGLILGELTIVAVAMILSLMMKRNLGIDLNRH